jgi:hypothetical protein
MSRNTKAALVAALIIVAVPLLIVATVFITRQPNSRLAATEQYAVYSAYLESEITENFHDYGTGKGFVLLIQERTTSVHIAMPRFRRLKADAPTLQDATLMNFVAENLTSQLLAKQFRLPIGYKLLSEEQLVRPGSHQYVTVSRVGFNKDLSQALFYTEHICGLCGGGGYVLMERRLGQWRVKAFLSTWVS